LTRWMYDEIKGQNTLLLKHEKATVIEKTGYSGLTTETQKVFEEKGIEEVHITGVDSEGAVLATMFSCLDAGYVVKVLERMVASYHGRNWESMMIARHVVGAENVVNLGGGRVYM
jgi:nicotinamidase-related amidase